MKNLKKICISLLISIATLTAVSADTVENISNFTPDRPGIPFVEGILGLSYPSFNNFTDNPNIAATGGDERKFLTGRLCDGVCTAGGNYSNTIEEDPSNGDNIRFSVYFHNNGSDSHDGDSTTSPDATNVQIGIDLNNINDQTHAFIKRPRGFILADNNEYRTDTNNPATVIKDSSGNVTRTATDDMQVNLPEGFSMELIENSAHLQIAKNDTEIQDLDIKNPTTFTIKTIDGESVTITATPKIEGNKIWITFDKMPGCFRYSGFIFFDAKIKKKEIPKLCTDLNITKNIPVKINGQNAHELSANYTIQGAPEVTGKVLWTSDDPTTIFLGPDKQTVIGTGTAKSNKDETIYYIGDAPITATLTDVPSTINTSKCSDKVRFEQEEKPGICKNLKLTTKDVIKDNKNAHELSANFLLENPFAGLIAKIRWTSADPNAVFQDANGEEIGIGEAFSNKDEIIYYFSDAPVEAEVINVSAKVAPFDFSNCKAKLKFPKKIEICEDLKVNYPKEITEGVISKFTAKAVDPNGEDFNGKITYSVDPQYGTFYTNKPSGTPDNNSPQIKEFDNTKPIKKPIGGFCPDTVQAKPDSDETKGSGTIVIEKVKTGETGPRDTEPATDTGRTGGSETGGADTGATDTGAATQTPLDFAGGNLGGASTETQVKITIDILTGDFLENVDTQNFFKQIQDLNINQYIPGPIDWPQGGPDPTPNESGASPFKNGQASLIAAFDNPFGGPYPKAEDVTDLMVKPILDPEDLYQQPKIDEDDSFNPKKPKIEYLFPQYFQSGSTITVEPGTVVYFVPKKPGKNVIKIDTECTDEKNCTRYFDITPAPKLICEAVEFTATIQGTKIPVSSLKPGVNHILKAEFFTDDAKTEKIPSHLVKVKWTTTDPNGEFFDQITYAQDVAAGKTPVGTKGTFFGPYVVLYKGGGEVKADLVEIDGKPVNAPDCKAQIGPEKNICASMEIISTPTEPLTVGQEAILRIISKDIFGNSLPATTKVIWGTNTEGTLSFGEKNSKTTLPLTHGEQPVNFKDSRKAGNVTLVMDPTDPLYSERCKDAILVQEKPVPPVCIDIIVKDSTTVLPKDLEPNKVYKLNADATYSGTKEPQTVNYKIDGTVGFFFDPNLSQTVKAAIITATPKTLDAFSQDIPLGIIKTEVTVNDNAEVTLVTFSNIPASKDKVLKVKAVGTPDGNCEKEYNIKVTVTPPEEVCIDLDIINPDKDWKVDNKTKQTFTIEVEPKSLEDDLYYNWVVKQGEGEWENGDDEDHDSTAGDTTNELTEFTKTTAVEVYASTTPGGSKIEKCKDTREAQEAKKDKPTIKKVVYKGKGSKAKTDKADDLLNIGNKTKDKFLTYKITFEANTEAEWVEISEERFDDEKIPGSKDGSLDFEDMRINVEDGNEKYTILKTDNYDNDNDDEDFDEDDGKFKDIDTYADKYSCDEDTKKVCIEEENFDRAVNNFTDGEPIKFKNISARTKIFIKVQVKNNTTIDDATCKKLEAKDGCGESFKNKASFETSNKDAGDDKAEVIAICPFILTRQGGDVFFKDVLDTGVDVAKCSKVKTSVGPGITEEKEQDRKNIKTGTDKKNLPDRESILDLPSHDICRYSNSKENHDLDQYSDVLENFSSTICELKTEIAEEWKETNINDAINANITRIARWSKNLTKAEINSIDDLIDLENYESGIFVRDEDLYINGLEIAGKGKLPAAQTYIVKNHDLHITSNIVYAATTDYSNPKNIPSAAFIVINGNIIIDDDVTQIDAILMSIKGDKGGEIRNDTESTSELQLVINGSLFGNVIDLFRSRIGVGDPTSDEGSITIRYDARILLNTPPGLGELIDIQQAIVPN